MKSQVPPQILRLLPSLIGLAACDWSRSLSSDPSAWSPAATVEEQGTSSGATLAPDASSRELIIPEECTTAGKDPPFDPGIRQSLSAAISHRPSEPCLEKCHEAGGSAKLTLAVAGTVHRAQGERVPVATGGTIHGVAGTTLTLDRCGNFYAIATALATQPQLTQPFVQNPTLRRMEKPLVREQAAGSCNRTTCHDFSASSKSGVYY